MQHLPTAADTANTSARSDPLINSAEAKRLAAGISGMTLWRWERAGIIPPAIVIRHRKYWHRLPYLAALQAAGSPKCGRTPDGLDWLDDGSTATGREVA